MNFKEAYTALLDMANKSGDSQFENAAKREINSACFRAARKHAFAYQKKLVEITYPAGTEEVSLSSLISEKPSGVISAKTESGRPLKVKTYDELRAWALEREEVQPNRIDLDYLDPGFSELRSFSTFLQQTYGQVLYLNGSLIGLVPPPSDDLKLKLHINTVPDELSADSDTNFFLEHCWDYILLSALQRFNLYLREEQRFPVTREMVMEEWEDLLRWDATVRTSQGI